MGTSKQLLVRCGPSLSRFRITQDAVNADGTKWGSKVSNKKGDTCILGNGGEVVIYIIQSPMQDGQTDVHVVRVDIDAPIRSYGFTVSSRPNDVSYAVNRCLQEIEKQTHE